MNNLHDIKGVLGQVFEFTDADIAANHKGKMSEAQKQRMERKHHDDSRTLWIGLLIFAAVGLVGSTAAALHEGIPLLEMWLGLVITMVVIGGILWIIMIYNRTRMYRTIRDGAFQKVRGRIQLIREGNKPTEHYFSVGGQKFSIFQHDYFLLNQAEVANHEVVVYYTTRWRYILSIELP
ncbi:MAG: hypothetical protein H6672_15665 [Anaerolineaceae bacterium]|nr:hypothetical protein [Anaerolineaceae bacterium]